MFVATPLLTQSMRPAGRRSECQAQGRRTVSQETCLVTDSHLQPGGV